MIAGSAGGATGRPPMAVTHDPARAADPVAALRRNVLALISGLLLWTAGHFGVLAMLPLFLHDQGYDTRGIGFMLGATGVAQLGARLHCRAVAVELQEGVFAGGIRFPRPAIPTFGGRVAHVSIHSVMLLAVAFPWPVVLHAYACVVQ